MTPQGTESISRHVAQHLPKDTLWHLTATVWRLLEIWGNFHRYHESARSRSQIQSNSFTQRVWNQPQQSIFQQSDPAQMLGFTGKAGPVNWKNSFHPGWLGTQARGLCTCCCCLCLAPSAPNLHRLQAWLHLAFRSQFNVTSSRSLSWPLNLRPHPITSAGTIISQLPTVPGTVTFA